jgi:hypothetical protein
VVLGAAHHRLPTRAFQPTPNHHNPSKDFIVTLRHTVTTHRPSRVVAAFACAASMKPTGPRAAAPAHACAQTAMALAPSPQSLGLRLDRNEGQIYPGEESA